MPYYFFCWIHLKLVGLSSYVINRIASASQTLN